MGMTSIKQDEQSEYLIKEQIQSLLDKGTYDYKSLAKMFLSCLYYSKHDSSSKMKYANLLKEVGDKAKELNKYELAGDAYAQYAIMTENKQYFIHAADMYEQLYITTKKSPRVRNVGYIKKAAILYYYGGDINKFSVIMLHSVNSDLNAIFKLINRLHENVKNKNYEY